MRRLILWPLLLAISIALHALVSSRVGDEIKQTQAAGEALAEIAAREKRQVVIEVAKTSKADTTPADTGLTDTGRDTAVDTIQGGADTSRSEPTASPGGCSSAQGGFALWQLLAAVAVVARRTRRRLG